MSQEWVVVGKGDATSQPNPEETMTKAGEGQSTVLVRMASLSQGLGSVLGLLLGSVMRSRQSLSEYQHLSLFLQERLNG